MCLRAYMCLSAEPRVLAVQVQGKDRELVANTARQLGMEGSYIPRSYIEQVCAFSARPGLSCCGRAAEGKVRELPSVEFCIRH